MANIDFLPSSYRERNALRAARSWWGVVGLVFGSVIVATAIGQFTWKRSLQRQLDELAPRTLAADQRDRDLLRVSQQVQVAGESAHLYVYLRHPWPRTQILAAIVTPTPESVKLQEIHLTLESVSTAVAEGSSNTLKTATTETATATKSPHLLDLEALRQQCDGQCAVVAITGKTSDVQQLHAYVEALAKSPLVAKLQLQSLATPQASPDIVEAKRTLSQFALFLKLKPGYGQAGGPELTVAESKNVVQSPRVALQAPRSEALP